MSIDQQNGCVFLPDSQVSALASDALGPAQIEAKAEALAVGKAALGTSKCFVLAVLAGLFIGCGASFFGMVMGDSSLGFFLQRFLGGLCFCLGLQLILCCGAELFTGNSLMVCGLMSGKISVGALAKNWAVVWLGNLLGSALAAFLVYNSNMPAMNGGAVGDALVSVAVGKTTLEASTIVFKGIMCNLLVCLAVWSSFGARTTVDKIAGVILPISGFITMGFEHSVANMYFVAMGLLCKAAGYGEAVANVDLLTPGSSLYNLVFASIGNVIGGAVLVGLSYWFVYHKKDKPAA